jgi:phage terminase large subunit-like protein
MLGFSIRACAARLKPFLFKEKEQAEVWDRKPWRECARPEQLPPDGDWTTWLILAGRGWGKALALDTPIPTPTGWTTMGRLGVGDLVLDEHGQPCRVTFATEVMCGHVCHDVVFDDGSVITADAEHLWLTRTPGNPPAVRTTEQIRASLANGVVPFHSVDIPYLRTSRLIVDVRDRESVPVRCIKVDSPSLLFLAGPSMVPTHNTRTGAEAVIEEAQRDPKARIALVGRTSADVRDVMIEGDSGILACSPPDFKPIYEPSKRRLTWPNGAIATAYSAEKPDQLRGPQHTFAWADELAAWFMGAKRGKRSGSSGVPEAWEQLQFGLRLGERPRAIVTTTPRPVKIIRDLIADVVSGATALTKGRTADNAKNLAKSFLKKIVAKFAGSRLGRQELDGEVLDDAPGALWKRKRIDELRREKAPDLYRIVVGVDPAASSGEESAETGIIVAGVGYDGHGYLLEDLSGRYKPEEWAAIAVDAYDRYKANYIVAEKNNGGDMVEATVRAACLSQMLPPQPGEDRPVRKAMVPYRAVSAAQGKETRAEPIAVFCEQGLIHHVWEHPARRNEESEGGLPLRKNPFVELEDQQCTWDPNAGMASPDRIDAYVWAFSKLPIGVKRRPSNEVDVPDDEPAAKEFRGAWGF